MNPLPTAGLDTSRVWHRTTATGLGVMDTVCGLKAIPYLLLVSPGGPPYSFGTACEACHAR